MNMKILMDTLTQIPDPQLLTQLILSIHTHKQLLIPSPAIYYKMLSTLFSCNNKKIKSQAIDLYKYTFSILLKTQVQISWSHTSKSIIWMLGEEDVEIRKKSRDLIMDVIQATNNANIVLEKLYNEGLEDQSVLTILSSINAIYKILELYPTILHNKTSIRIVKLIIQKMIAMAMSSKHIELQKSSKQFMEKLFYLQIQKFDEVLTLLNPKVLEFLQELWAKNKQKMLQKQVEDNQKQANRIMSIKYEHLPLINGKFFGIYQPYVLKNIFNPEVQAAKHKAIQQFRQIFEENFEHLQKYINIIFKIIVKFIAQKNYELLLMLKKIVLTPGVNNIINLTVLPIIIIGQLDTENVLYRRQLRVIFQKLNFQVSKQCLQAYEEQLKNTGMSWIGMYQIISLCEHWIDNNMESSYPPTLQKILEALCHNMNSLEIKVKEKSLDILLMILDRYPGYRENLQDHFSQERINEIEDAIEKRKNKGRGNSMSQQAQQIFMKQYNEERQRFIKFKKQIKKAHK